MTIGRQYFVLHVVDTRLQRRDFGHDRIHRRSVRHTQRSEDFLQIDKVDLSNGRFKDSIEMQDNPVGTGS